MKQMQLIVLKAKINAWVISVFLLFKDKIMLMSH